MTWAGWAQLVALVVAPRDHRPAARSVHRARLRGRPVEARPGLRPGREPLLPGLPDRQGPRAALERLHALGARVQRRRLPPPLRDPADPEQSARSTRPTWSTWRRRSSFNTAVSFVTNTNWQSYGGENTLSHLTQMMGLTVQNFVSAAAGMAVMVALIRGLARAGQRTIGNFWVDLIRTTLRILLPIAFVFAIVFIASGVIQNTNGFTGRPHGRRRHAADPRRSGGEPGCRSSSSARTAAGSSTSTPPTRSRTPAKISDFLELYAITLIPFALAFTFGRMVKDQRQGYAVARHHGRAVPSAPRSRSRSSSRAATRS